ncbi:MAG: sigma-70 family RNA polymerase sigma factor [Clostridia bacterium]|nr:sigma-70 family RNA polymerase sigma factor [Clostridia bacterium]
MDSFDELLERHRAPVERYVRYRLNSREDSEDVLQEVYVAAFQKFGQLKNAESFKPWILAIARNKLNDYFRSKAKRLEIPIDALSESSLGCGRTGISVKETVRDTLELLGDNDAQILYLYYWKEMPQTEIAERLSLPVGTVKSRMYAAKQHFRMNYPYHPAMQNGGTTMTKLPEFMPEYAIKPVDKPPFEVRWEELMGWLIVPKLGEKLSWGLYDFVSRRRTEYTDMKVVGRAEVHGIEGVEIAVSQHNTEDYYRTGAVEEIERTFIAQLTDTHCRYLAESHMESGVRRNYTFLDEHFMLNWGYGEDNCGTEVHVAPKEILRRKGGCVAGGSGTEVTMDVVGRYEVTIGGKTFDTICLMDVECFDDAIVSEQYLDKNGRTVLWRRFNRDDWAFRRYQKKWTEMLPDNERLTVNGETFVHWYDCISDYIL